MMLPLLLFAQPALDVAAPSAEQMAQTHYLCVKPKKARKSCDSLTIFDKTDDGGYIAQSSETVGSGLILKSAMPMRFSGNIVCGELTLEVATQSRISTTDGEMGVGEIVSNDPAKLNRIFSGTIGKTICNKIIVGTQFITIQVLVNDQLAGSFEGKWIPRDDVYIVK